MILEFFVAFEISFENLVRVEDYSPRFVSFVNITMVVVPAWTAATQVQMDVSGRILRSLDTGNPCRHDGGC